MPTHVDLLWARRPPQPGQHACPLPTPRYLTGGLVGLDIYVVPTKPGWCRLLVNLVKDIPAVGALCTPC